MSGGPGAQHTSSSAAAAAAASGAYHREGDEDPQLFCGVDLDRVFAYRTFKVVNIQDRWLGLLYWSIVTMIILYFAIFNLWKQGRHQFQEPGNGFIVAKVKGKSIDAANPQRAFDISDLRFPEIEASGVFIASKIMVQRGQQVGDCVDFTDPCPCRPPATCDEATKHCKGANWCPTINEATADKSSDMEITKVKGLDKLVLDLQAGIAFPNIGNYLFVASIPEFRNITLAGLLNKTHSSLTIDAVSDTGVLLGVTFLWDCDVTMKCEPYDVKVERLDRDFNASTTEQIGTQSGGFTQKRAHHYRDSGSKTDRRDAYFMRGIRILVDSQGIGRKVALTLIVIQIGACMALLRTATLAADFLMLYLYPKKRRDLYYKCKVVESEDYSDLRDRLNLVKTQAPEKLALLRRRNRALRRGEDRGAEELVPAAGAAVKLSLGSGGRGGPSSIGMR
ncbi:unnamed protein product [Vitrella brassicaformis CCMP3155]|uniref:P2X purinoceptor n=2 Tax=Vitrella brassicaformis TaxID=1169539 RepID=A0A0G4ENC4_VITBC|nr:unnamed protein product [Vitrella brassicaformis CCMP3155]|eukprot:CEL98497.1 unnamed protein product [Vitrella brassicaformis CCMP3155]